ncbi:MAG: hypothetical protein PHN72_01400 [Bacilli bacterium]|nr:hypothetical protein [Bacilli bacterium]
MNQTEYEYSFKVTDIEPFIEYCIKNEYEKVEETKQTRVLYKKPDKTMARVTTKEKNNQSTTFLDFKEDGLSDNVLGINRETGMLKVENMDVVEDILSFLQYKKEVTLKRNRAIYQKGEVVFEIDNYTEPEAMYVVAVEGLPKEVDPVYEDVQNKLKEYFL